MVWPSSSCAFDLHLQSTVMITIVTGLTRWSLSSRQLLLLRLSLPLSDEVKQLHGDCISYNKATTIWLLPVADNFVTKHDHLIQQFIYHHVLTISHHNMPCKNKLDVLYFVVASLRSCYGLSKNRSYLRIKNHNNFSSSVMFKPSTRSGHSHTRFN